MHGAISRVYTKHRKNNRCGAESRLQVWSEAAVFLCLFFFVCFLFVSLFLEEESRRLRRDIITEEP